MTRRRTVHEEVAEVMAVGVDDDPGGLDTPHGDDVADATEPTVAERPEPDDRCAAVVERDDASERVDTSARGAVGRLVAELLADPGLSYEAIVDRVMGAHPTARTTVRSVASTASAMRKKGTAVPMRRPSKPD
ncbi:MAG: hypothetical protein ACKVPY_08560 [Paracoccaceae bacterium]